MALPWVHPSRFFHAGLNNETFFPCITGETVKSILQPIYMGNKDPLTSQSKRNFVLVKSNCKVVIKAFGF